MRQQHFKQNYQNHTNQIRTEKDRIRANLQHQINKQKRQEQFRRQQPDSLPIQYSSTMPNVQNRRIRRPSVREISGLTGHRTEQTNNGSSTTENFTGLGNILNQNPSYHFSNHHFQPGVLRSQASRDENAGFRKYIDNERRDEERQRQLAVSSNDLLKTNSFHRVN